MNQLAQQGQQTKGTEIQLSGAKKKLADMFLSAGIQAILPSHISMDQFVQVAAIAYMKEPKLQEATKETVMMAFSECAKDGLIPNGKEAFINCYRRNFGSRQNPNYQMIAEYQPMIEGVLKRARNSGDVSFIDVGVVFPEEDFEHWTGIEGKHFKHVPRYDIDRSMNRIHLFYGIAKLKSGEVKVEVMSREDVDKVREVSLAKNGPTWNVWYDRMGLKAVGHRLCRQLPKGSELVAMLEKGDEKDFGNEIDITPQKPTQAIEGLPAASVESLMGGGSDTGTVTGELIQEESHAIEHKPEPQTGVEDLMGGGQSMTVNEESSKIEDMIMSIGTSGDRQKTITEYRAAVQRVKDALSLGAITVEEANKFNAQLSSVHAGLSGKQ